MQVIRCAHVDDVDRRIGDQGPPVRGRTTEAERAARRRCPSVVDVGDDAVTLAVDEDDAAGVAYAVTAGVVTLALSGTSWRR